jgi:DNA-binding response OmpR family regulator
MRQTILIVDDDADLSRLLSSVLSKEYEVLVTASGKQGLQWCAKHQPHLVLLDLELPDIAGRAVLKTILARRYHTAVVVLSANPSLSLAREIVKLGACDYMSKPFDMDELREMIRAAIDGLSQPQDAHVLNRV